MAFKLDTRSAGVHRVEKWDMLRVPHYTLFMCTRIYSHTKIYWGVSIVTSTSGKVLFLFSERQSCCSPHLAWFCYLLCMRHTFGTRESCQRPQGVLQSYFTWFGFLIITPPVVPLCWFMLFPILGSIEPQFICLVEQWNIKFEKNQ